MPSSEFAPVASELGRCEIEIPVVRILVDDNAITRLDQGRDPMNKNVGA